MSLVFLGFIGSSCRVRSGFIEEFGDDIWVFVVVWGWSGILDFLK